jgi:hypothetical protein
MVYKYLFSSNLAMEIKIKYPNDHNVNNLDLDLEVNMRIIMQQYFKLDLKHLVLKPKPSGISNILILRILFKKMRML